MSESYLLGVDLGAGSLKATIIDGNGGVAGEGSHPIETSMPKFGWSEQDPDSWYEALCRAVPAALAAAAVDPGAIRGIGLSGGAHIPVLTDAEDRVLRPAIMWNDQRSAAEARELHEAAGELIIAKSLNRVNPTWAMAMLKWLGRHEPQVVARARRLYIAKDYLRSRLTGTWETDYSDVLGALMADDATRSWSPELCALIDWPLDKLPPVVRPEAVVGGVTAEAAARTGLAEGTPVVCGSNDTTVEFFGVGALEPGMGAIKLATAGVLFLATRGPSVNPPISCYPHIVDGLYYTATGTNSCASAHRWLRDRFFLGPDGDGAAAFAEMDRLAGAIAPGSEGLLFHPYLQGERAPYWDPLLRADFVGMTMRHQRGHFARALYEGIAFSIRDLLEAARQLGLDFTTIRLMGGGARSATWRQIIADVTGLEIERPANGDASFGAALVAGMGVGLFASPREAVERCVRILDRCPPDPERHAFYSQLFGLYKQTQAALAPINHRLHALVEQG
ncbi:xylulokinase [Tistlia consotensis]|uniref:Xylulokinase n=1 Tax=Tistlia consotensis USBA 355 TaxID=560819 RepID=A0A1Y6BML3_9PROT|nr:xylulokinase [Tistlia consotensis]SMF19302.1 xylulokinase [Tistlia consotensis USBA 355]SNR39070.1 xylulokinase [Tistlia consotensis]